MTNNTPESWEERFWKKFGSFQVAKDDNKYHWETSDFITFIRKTFKEERARLREKIEGIPYRTTSTGFVIDRDDILKLLS